MSNFLVALRGGDPGGESGISKFGTGGIVKLRIAAWVAEYGEIGIDPKPSTTFSVSGSGIAGPSEGPSEGASTVIGVPSLVAVASGSGGG